MDKMQANKQKFSDTYTAKWPCIVSSRKGVKGGGHAPGPP